MYLFTLFLQVRVNTPPRNIRLDDHNFPNAQIEEDEGVVSCWALERKMGMARKTCAHTSTMDHFEVGHLARMWNEQLRQLENPSWAKVLQGKILDCIELALALGTADAQVSSSVRWRHAIHVIMCSEECHLPRCL